ncbi:MAG TPA: DinB family protein, partial [Vicinamibacterales bacterium]|nr:DinB family protein [Vicinamibacterales bacterium]
AERGARPVHEAPFTLVRDAEEGDWPPAPQGAEATAEAWRAAVEALARAQEDLVSAARAVSPERLHAPVVDPRVPEPGTGATHYVTLHGIAQHDAYHGGQIALLKKASATPARGELRDR